MQFKKFTKSVLPVVLSAAMVAGPNMTLLAAQTAPADAVTTAEDGADAADELSISNATKTELNVTVDGKALKVTEYVDQYVKNPTDVSSPANEDGIDQKIDIYVPETATKDSPIIFCVNNSGWMADAWAQRQGRVEDGKEYDSSSDSDKVAMALSKGYVIVTYGCRSRADRQDADGKYISHSPATMTDTKAAIRYLRNNVDSGVVIGNTDRIVITGTSGGGALSSIIAASGNSADYFESLYEIGAAGITKNEDGSYTSDPAIGDDVFATIAYCPINDLRRADAAYEWTYQETRKTLLDEGTAEFQNNFSENYTEEFLRDASAALAEDYSTYVNGLGLKLDDGTALTADNLEEAIQNLLKAEIDESIEEIGIEQMTADVNGEFPRANTTNQYNSSSENWKTWLTINEDGTYEFDYDQYLYTIARNNKLKVACAFSNAGLNVDERALNEDSLYGTEDYPYSAYEFYSWNHDAVEGNGCGLDDTGLTWDEYMATDDGKALDLQLRMSTPISYLTDAEDGDSAEYWYVRHGMADRDTSFALQTVLRYAISNDESIKGYDFEFAWFKPHSGDYDVQEAYAWLDKVLAEAEPEKPSVEADLSIETLIDKKDLTVTVNGQSLGITEYIDQYVTNPTSVSVDGQDGRNKDENYDGIDQKIDIYVPETATADSPILFVVNNSGWQADSWSQRSKIEDGAVLGGENDRNPQIAMALSKGYVIVTYGCRSRADGNGGVEDGKYISHSPATMTDTKAAIRYLRNNVDKGIVIGNTDRIVVTGTSGGGALSTVIAASGNSEDYYPSLAKIGAAGITENVDGTYTSAEGIGDDVFATIAYCPINDLRRADAAYEWTYGETRKQLINDGKAEFNKDYNDTYTQDFLLAASDALAADYSEYVNGLGLKLDDGTALTADNLEAAIIGLLEDEIKESMDEVGIDQMRSDVDGVSFPAADTKEENRYNSASEGWTPWLTINDDKTFNFDYDKYLYTIARNKKLKIACAFSNAGLVNAQNEDNLFGTEDQAYTPYEFYSWENDMDPENGVGADNSDCATWDEYMATEEGKALALQLKMASPIPYLTGEDGTECEPAEYWYVRHGMADRDTSFALQTVLRYAISNNTDIKDYSFEFAWFKPHSGDYDVPEAYAWLDEVLAKADGDEPVNPVEKVDLSTATVTAANAVYTGKKITTAVTVTVNGQTVPASEYTVSYADNKNAGKATVTVTAKADSESYTGSATGTFKITKAAQPITLTKTSKSIKVNKLKKQKVTFTLKATGAKGDLKVTSNNKAVKVTASGKKVTVTVKKNTGKGTYTVSVKAKANTNYKASTVQKCKIKVA